jgi:hypothetical protein
VVRTGVGADLRLTAMCGAVVATDTASVNADYDNGKSGLLACFCPEGMIEMQLVASAREKMEAQQARRRRRWGH